MKKNIAPCDIYLTNLALRYNARIAFIRYASSTDYYFQLLRQGLPGWPTQRTTMRTKLMKVWGKITKSDENLRKNEESGILAHPGFWGWLRPWLFCLFSFSFLSNIFGQRSTWPTLLCDPWPLLLHMRLFFTHPLLVFVVRTGQVFQYFEVYNVQFLLLDRLLDCQVLQEWLQHFIWYREADLGIQ